MIEQREKMIERWIEELEADECQQLWLCAMLECFTLEELSKPFILRDMAKGTAREMLATRYNISEDKIRGIGQKAGHYEKTG